jgi:hypothetical protein
MIVNRRTFIVKQGNGEQAAELLKNGTSFTPFLPPFRIYISDIGQFNQVALEIEFKDLAEYDRFWTTSTANAPEDWWKAWFSATENGGANEIWKLV